MKLAVVLVISCIGLAAASSTLRPVIGILTLPNDLSHYNGSSYFPASYVKWVESGGARVVPIKYDQPLEDIVALVRSLNGALFTGGAASFFADTQALFFEDDGSLSTFGLAGKAVFDTIIAMNKEGSHVPLWGTCLGFQFINVLASGANDTLLEGGFDSENLTLPLDFTTDGTSSRMMTAAGSSVVDILKSQPVTMNNHHDGVTPDNFNTNPILPGFFDVISTNKDREGREFLSTVEAKEFPIYAAQWHAEKVQFEWNPNEVINHDYDAVHANAFFARFLGGEARRNNNTFPTPDALAAALIYNWPAVYTEDIQDFDQCYFFEK